MGDRGFRFGDWQIDPDSNTLSNGTVQAQLEPRAMDVLRYLCRHPGAVIPTEEILEACWGSSEMGDNPIHKAITQLRRALGDSASEPRYIETVRKRGYRAIAAVIANEAAEEGSWLQGSPFRGLEAFQENHAAIFFGRMQACSQLRELVTKQTELGSAMALVLGPSGSGKTSLVRAGLLPQLMEAQAGPTSPIALACTLYMDCADLAEGNLFQALAAVLIDAEVDGKLLFSGENAEALGKQLESSGAETIAGRFEKNSGRIRISLFVDRLEAIFLASGITDDIRSRFIALLEQLSRSDSILVVLACRNDFYPDVVALPALMALKARGGHFDLTPPDGADIAQIVRLPARAAQLRFEQDLNTGANLDDVLCDAARGSPDTLPLLQYCLNELYRQRSEDGELRFEVFQQLGGIEGSIAVRAEQVVAALAPTQRAALSHVLSLLVGVSEEQSAVTARRAAWSALQGAEARELVRALVEARLFVSELAGDVPSFGVAHEALLRRWPRVAEWIEKYRHALQIRTRISQDAVRWTTAGRPRDLLLPRGSQVNQARSLLDLDGFALSSTEQEYVRSSLKRVKIGERLWIVTMALVFGLAILAGILGLSARSAQRNAETHRTEAEGLMGYMLGDFVEKLRPLGRLDLLDGISNKALAYLSAANTEGANSTALTQRAKALQVIAEVNVARSNPEKATEALIAARTILQQQYSENSSDKALLKDLGANAFWLGQIHLNRNEWDKAYKFFDDYRRLSERIVSIAPNDVDGWIELSYAHSSLGSTALKRGNLPHAAESFEISVNLKRKSIEKDPSNQKLAVDLANGVSWLADTKAQLGMLDEAMQLFKQEEEILRPLHASKPQNAQWTYRLANALWHQGELKFALGHSSSAQSNLRIAESLYDSIVRHDSSNRSWQINLHSIQLKLYESYMDAEEVKSVLPKQSALLEKLIALGELEPNRAKLTQLVAMAQQGLGNTYFKLRRMNEAEKHLSNSLAIFDSLHKFGSTDPQLSARFASLLLARAEFDHFQGKPDAAKQNCIKAQRILSEKSGQSSDYRLLSPLVRAYACTGDISAILSQQRKLELMKYQEVHYVQYLSTVLKKKGTQ